MCGICGVYNVRSGQPVSRELVEQMTGMISHRGPDDRGVYLEGNVGLGIVRLSIIDLSGGHQPMSNETGDIWVVFNGDIWNYKVLRKKLIDRGHYFRTNLEARIPLLDHHLIEYAASIPSAVKVRPFQAKYLLKRAYAHFLPKPVLTRKKMGFNVPTGVWFREGQREIITRLLLSERARSRGFLNNE